MSLRFLGFALDFGDTKLQRLRQMFSLDENIGGGGGEGTHMINGGRFSGSIDPLPPSPSLPGVLRPDVALRE